MLNTSMKQKQMELNPKNNNIFHLRNSFFKNFLLVYLTLKYFFSGVCNTTQVLSKFAE